MAATKTAYSAQAIVLGRTNFGEADRIIRLFSRERGKLSAIAKGVRKIKSRAGGHLEPFGEVHLMIIPGRNLDTITSARLSWYPHELTLSYERLNLAFALTLAIDRLTEPGQSQPAIFLLLKDALQALNAGHPRILLELWFKLRLLDLLGYRPELASCAICSQHDTHTFYAFSLERGGIVCHSDSQPLDTPMTTEQIKFWRLLSDYPYDTIAHIASAAELAQATLSLCDSFYEHHLGRAFKPSMTGEPL